MALYEQISELCQFIGLDDELTYTEYASKFKTKTSSLVKEIVNNTGLLTLVLLALGEFVSFIIQLVLTQVPLGSDDSQVLHIVERGFPYDICFVVLCSFVGCILLAIIYWRSDVFWSRNSKYSIHEIWKENNNKITESVKTLLFIFSYFICFTFHLIVCSADDTNEQFAIAYKVYTGAMLLFLIIFYGSHFHRRKNMLCRGKKCMIVILLCLTFSAMFSILVGSDRMILCFRSYSVFTLSFLEIISTVAILIEFTLTLWFLCVLPFYHLFKFAYDARHKPEVVETNLNNEDIYYNEDGADKDRPRAWFIRSIAIFAIIFIIMLATIVLIQAGLLFVSGI